MLPILSYVQHYKKYHAARFEAASVQYGLNQLEIDILLFLHNNPDCRTASDICRYRGLAKSNVSAAVERLRVRGVLTVSPAPDNRRQRLLGFAPDLRDYGIGAQILADLGVHEMILLSNSEQHVVAIEGYELTIVGQRPIP